MAFVFAVNIQARTLGIHGGAWCPWALHVWTGWLMGAAAREQVPAQQQYSMVNYFVCSKPIDRSSVLCAPLRTVCPSSSVAR